jgi:hypothetical protein
MAAPKKREEQANNRDNPDRDEAAKRAGAGTPLRQEIRARNALLQQGDVGRAETNEEIFRIRKKGSCGKRGGGEKA